MEEIINTLQEWKENIDYDIRQAHIGDEEKRANNIRQSIALSTAIGILQGIGANESNIPK